MLLAKHLDSQHNWLLTEFIETSIVQFIDQISSEITGQEDGVHPLIERQIHETSKCDARRFSQTRTDGVRATRECGVEVYVGGVYEAHQLPGIVNAWAGVPKLGKAGGRGPGLKGRYSSARASGYAPLHPLHYGRYPV